MITNLPATVSISEDATTTLTLFTVATSDNNPGDTYTCVISNTDSVEPFYLERNPPVSGSKDNNIFSKVIIKRFRNSKAVQSILPLLTSF